MRLGGELKLPHQTEPGRKYELNWINGGLTFGYRDTNTRGGA